MKATQNNAAWVSNTYEQGSTEDNWAKMAVSYRVPSSALTITEASTSALTVLDPTDGISGSDSLSLYNATDGNTDYSAVVTSTEYPNNLQKDLDGTGSTVESAHTYWDTTTEGLIAWNGDGSRCFTLSAGGIIKEYSAPRNWDIKGASSEGPTLASTHTPDFSGESTPNYHYATGHFAANGVYFYLMTAEWKYVYRWTLSTAYDLSTAGTIQVFNCGQGTSDKWVTTLFSADSSDTTSELATGGFCGLGFSTDGKKGLFFRRDNRSGGSAQMPENLVWSFELSTAYDLDTITSGKYDRLSFSNSTTYNLLHGQVSPCGKIIYGVDAYEGASMYLKRISLTTAWDVKGGDTQLSLATISSTNHQSSNSYAYTCYYTISPDGQYVSLEQNRFYLFNYNTEDSPYWPRTVLDITSASQTVAPTKAFQSGGNVSGLSYQQLTRADAAKEDQAISVSSTSTGTSLVVHTPMDFQGSTALSNTQLSIDGTSFTTGTPTYTASDLAVGTNTTAQNVASKGAQIETNAKYIGLFQYDDPAVRGYRDPATWLHAFGMAFSTDGTKLFVSGYDDGVNFSALGGASSVDDCIAVWDLSTPWDVSTKSFNSVFDGGTFKGAPSDPSTNYEAQDFAFSTDGTKFYILHSFSTGGLGYLYEGNLSTPWDLSTYSYENHIALSGTGSLLDIDYIYSFAISPDGKAIKVFFSGTTGALSATSYCDSHRIKLATPWSLASATNGGTWSTTSDYRGSLWGDETYGYTGFSTQYAAGSYLYNDFTVSSASGNLSAVNAAGLNVDLSLGVEDWIDSAIGNSSTIAGKMVVVDNGTKLYIHFPQLHSVAMFTGPFGNFKDKYTFDVSSLGLTDQPKDVRFAVNTTYTAMPSASVTTTTDTYTEYTVADQGLDAEALRFKIEGDTGAEVTRFNVDLFT